MRMQNVSRLTVLAIIAVNLLSIDVASAKSRKITQILLTNKKEALQDPYFQLKTVKVKELTEEEALEFNDSVNNNISLHTKGFSGPNIPNVPPIPPTGGSSTELTAVTANEPAPTTRGALDSIIMVIDKLIAIGQKIIPTIKEGKAVVTNNPMASVSVLPRTDAKDPVVHDMGGWTVPVSKHYKIVYNNALGMEVVSFIYSVSYQYNGSMDGKGKYLAGIRASARNIAISWGFDLDATSQLLQISNVGTQQNVIAGATIEMSYTVKNWTRTLTTNESFFIAGDGRMWKLD
jgi:hypothetical protein